MDSPRKLKDEVERAMRVAGSLTDIRAAQEMQRYAREMEDKLLYQNRPPADLNI